MATLKECEDRFVELYLAHEKPERRDSEGQQLSPEEQELLGLVKNALARLELAAADFPKTRSMHMRINHTAALAMISGGCGLLLENLASAGTEGETGDEGDPPPGGVTATPNLKPGES